MIFAFDIPLEGKPDYFGLFLLPIAYVAGTVIEIVAYLITYYPKKWIGDRAGKLGLEKEEKHRSLKVEMLLRDNNLHRQLEMRSSRDRIARGMIVNSFGILIFLKPEILPIHLQIALLGTSIVTWVVFEYVSQRYFVSAVNVIQELKKREQAKSHSDRSPL